MSFKADIDKCLQLFSRGGCQDSWATFTLLRFHFYPFLLTKTLPVHIAPFSNRYAMKTIGVHIALAKRCC